MTTEKSILDDDVAEADATVSALSKVSPIEKLSPQRTKTAPSAPITPNNIKNSSEGGSLSNRLEESPDEDRDVVREGTVAEDGATARVGLGAEPFEPRLCNQFCKMMFVHKAQLWNREIVRNLVILCCLRKLPLLHGLGSRI